jgi:hypothetical protein
LLLIPAAALVAQNVEPTAQAVPVSEVRREATVADTTSSAAATADPVALQQDKRMFGVLPNYRTVDGSLPFAPITARHKFYIAAKDSFDYPIYYLSGGFAGLYQLENQNPSFGQGLKGYGKRYATSYADQAMGNLLERIRANVGAHGLCGVTGPDQPHRQRQLGFQLLRMAG